LDEPLEGNEMIRSFMFLFGLALLLSLGCGDSNESYEPDPATVPNIPPGRTEAPAVGGAGGGAAAPGGRAMAPPAS
jgi:hypothetical protein